MSSTPIVIEQGVKFSMGVTYDPPEALDPVGYTARAQVRKHAGGPLYGTFTTSLTGDGAGNLIVKLSLNATQTRGVASDGEYQIKIENATGDVI